MMFGAGMVVCVMYTTLMSEATKGIDSAAYQNNTAIGYGLLLLLCDECIPKQRAQSSVMAHELRPRRIYVVRHGLKEDSTIGKGNFDLELTSAGLDALSIVKRYLDADADIAIALCSPLFRRRQTASALMPPARIALEPGLSEELCPCP